MSFKVLWMWLPWHCALFPSFDRCKCLSWSAWSRVSCSHAHPTAWLDDTSLESSDFARHIFCDGFVNVTCWYFFFAYYVSIFFCLIVLSNNKHKWQGKQGLSGKERQKFINQKRTRIHNDKTPTSGIICERWLFLEDDNGVGVPSQWGRERSLYHKPTKERQKQFDLLALRGGYSWALNPEDVG